MTMDEGLPREPANGDPAPFKAQMVDDKFPLPPQDLRWGGKRYHSDAVYLEAGFDISQRIIDECRIHSGSRVLDIGCGQARILRGLIGHLGSLGRYRGIDVHRQSIEWLQCQVHLPFATFEVIDFANERYNPGGTETVLPTLDETFDAVILISVFTHMRLADITQYLHFIREALQPDGSVYLSAFIEDDVPEETENPPDYAAPSTGPLHRVRLDRQAFELRVRQAGLTITNIRRRSGQETTVYVLGRAN